jgi:hypothetical protein
MKVFRVAVLLAAGVVSTVAGAQSTTTATNQAGIDSDITLLRSDLQADRTALVTEEMQLTDAQGATFWPLYREYSNKQQIVGDQRVKVIKDYADKYTSMDDLTADDLAKRYMKFQGDRLKLRAEYYPKFKKAAGAKQAAKFMQIDNRLDMLVDLQISSVIPIVK